MTFIEVSFGHCSDSRVADRPILTQWRGVYAPPVVGDKIVLSIAAPARPAGRTSATFVVVDRLWHEARELYCVVRPWDGTRRIEDED